MIVSECKCNGWIDKENKVKCWCRVCALSDLAKHFGEHPPDTQIAFTILTAPIASTGAGSGQIFQSSNISTGIAADLMAKVLHNQLINCEIAVNKGDTEQ